MADLILVVDDNPLNAKLMRVLLFSAGFQVETAANGAEARLAVNRQIPSLILMDLQMPDIDGYTLTEEFKARPELRSVPVVAVTASAMRGDEERALSRGCDGYISKPIDTRTFVRTVSRFLPAVNAVSTDSGLN